MLPEGEWNPSLFSPAWAFSLVRLRTLYKVVPTFWYEVTAKKKPSLLIDRKTSTFLRVLARRLRKTLFGFQEIENELPIASTPLGRKLESLEALTSPTLRNDLKAYLMEGGGIRVGLTDEALYYLCWTALAIMKLSLFDEKELKELDMVFWEGENGLSGAFSGLMCSFIFLQHRKDLLRLKQELEGIANVLQENFKDPFLQQKAPYFFSALTSFYNLVKVFSHQFGDAQWPKLFPRRRSFIDRGNNFWKSLKGRLAKLN